MRGESGVERSTGNVGIGTTNPGAKLEVAGNIIASTPTATNHVATKGYVDALAIAYIVTTNCNPDSTSPPGAWCPTGWTVVESWSYLETTWMSYDEQRYNAYQQTLCSK